MRRRPRRWCRWRATRLRSTSAPGMPMRPARRESSGAAWHSPAPLRAPGPAAASSDQGPAATTSTAGEWRRAGTVAGRGRIGAAAHRCARTGAVGRKPELCVPARSGPRAGVRRRAAAPAAPARADRAGRRHDHAPGRRLAGECRSPGAGCATAKVSIDQECEQGLRQLPAVARRPAHVVGRPGGAPGARGGGAARPARRRWQAGASGGTAASSRRERTGTPSVVAAAASAPGARRCARRPGARCTVSWHPRRCCFGHARRCCGAGGSERRRRPCRRPAAPIRPATTAAPKLARAAAPPTALIPRRSSRSRLRRRSWPAAAPPTALIPRGSWLRRRSWPAAAPPALTGRLRHAPNWLPAPPKLAARDSARILRPRLRRRSWPAAARLRVVRAARRGEHRRSALAMLRSAHAGRRRGAPFQRLSGVTSGCATGGAAAIGTRSPVAAAIRPTCYRFTTCCRLPRGAARSRTISLSNAESEIMRSRWCGVDEIEGFKQV